jgi:hypothetical protein
MAKAKPNHKTVDSLFQTLIVSDVPPLIAKKCVNDALQVGKVLVDSHIAASARKTSPRRHWANPDEPEIAPPGGITAPVNPQSWDRVFVMAIRDGYLVIEPLCSLDFPWQFYSFSISNWEVAVDYLCRASAPSKSEPIPVAIVGPVKLVQEWTGKEDYVAIRRAVEERIWRTMELLSPKNEGG